MHHHKKECLSSARTTKYQQAPGEDGNKSGERSELTSVKLEFGE